MNKIQLEIKEVPRLGRGVFTILPILKDELVLDWTNGNDFIAKKASDLSNNSPLYIRDHAIQFDEDKYRDDLNGIARFINHSCMPNLGIRGRFQMVAMRNIDAGEQLTYDYEMTEDSDWRMECKCGNSNCRKVISAFTNMPKDFRERYKGYISDWLVRKYNL